MSEPLGVLFLVLFVIAGAACIYLSITISGRVQAGIDRWRGQERQALETELRSFADADARLRFEQWKQAHEQSIRLDAVHSLFLCPVSFLLFRAYDAKRTRGHEMGKSQKWHGVKQRQLQNLIAFGRWPV